MIVLSDENVVLYLINKGIYPEWDDQSVEITLLFGKNFNLRLQFANGQDWLVKQEAVAQSGAAEDFLGEWALQSLLRSWPELAALRAVVPSIELYDQENAILVSRFLTDFASLSDYYCGVEQPDQQVAAEIGHVIGTLHRLTFQQTRYRDFLRQIDDSVTDAVVPRSLSAIKRIVPESFGRVRSDAFGFFRWLQSHTGVIQAMAALATTWQPCCVLHQDLKFGNWLWCEATQEIRLIDWEKVNWGDPLTDLADILAAYLDRWLGSCSWGISSNLAQCLQTATLPLPVLQPSLQVLMQRYLTEFPQIAHIHPDWILQTLRFTGRELIDRVERVIQYRQPMGHREAATLRLAERLLCQPEIACHTIFGGDLRDTLTSPATHNGREIDNTGIAA
jgi:hypothetical protein